MAAAFGLAASGGEWPDFCPRLGHGVRAYLAVVGPLRPTDELESQGESADFRARPRRLSSPSAVTDGPIPARRFGTALECECTFV